MSVVGEFAVGTDRFALGRALAVDGVRVELDRVVPTVGHASDVWVWTADPERFVERVHEQSETVGVTLHDRTGERALCSVEWSSDEPDVFSGIVAADLTLLEATGDPEEWSFRVRARNWAALATFQEFCDRHDIDLRLDHLTRQPEPERSAAGALTSVQRETLAEAFQRGYYDSPRRVTLEDLAEEFDVSPRAVSQRLRRAIANLVESSLATDRRTS